MGKVATLNGREIGKYPVQEKKKNHLGLKIGLGVGIPTAIIGGFFGYKALTNNNQVSTAEVQAALAPQDKKVEVVKKDYGQEAVKDLKAGVLPIEDYSSKFEVGKYTQKDNPDRGPDFWNDFYGALVKHDPTMKDKYIKFAGLGERSFKEMCEIIGSGEGEDAIKAIKRGMKKSYPNFEKGLKVYIELKDGSGRAFYAFQLKGGVISIYGETSLR